MKRFSDNPSNHYRDRGDGDGGDDDRAQDDGNDHVGITEAGERFQLNDRLEPLHLEVQSPVASDSCEDGR